MSRTPIPDEVREGLNWCWVQLASAMDEEHRRIILHYMDTLLDCVPFTRD